MTFRSITATLGFLALTAGFSAVLLSQSQSGTLSGTITDESKAVIPGVTVTAVEEKSGKRSTTLSDRSGNYRLADLPPGTYTVTASLPGFQAVSAMGVGVNAQLQLLGYDLPINFTLRVAGVSGGFLLPPAGARDRDVNIRADNVTAQGATVHYNGNVEMTTGSVIVHADELDFNSATQQADARGNVRIQVLPITAKVRPLTN